MNKINKHNCSDLLVKFKLITTVYEFQLILYTKFEILKKVVKMTNKSFCKFLIL